MKIFVTNNLIALNIKATNLRISPQATTTWNNFKNLEDEFSGMKQHERCS
jgi:hypothetical protein